jgi:KaiC/GvpD/RAD55 family RecA-like ATPase
MPEGRNQRPREGGTPPGIASDRKQDTRRLPKCPTGIRGLDEITGGGLPKGRPTLVCGGAGSGKTLLAMEFLVRGVMRYDEPGVFMAFEETAEELTQNVRSLGFDLDDLADRKKILVDYVQLERSEIEETGEYDLEGLFVRLGYAIDSLGAKRVVLDTIETLFGGLSQTAILRAELRRLFRWLKDKGVTAVITGERSEGALTRQGLGEYVSDCVIVLDHRATEQVSTRRLRIVKYRGSAHGTNEYPFMIDEDGFSVLPITSLGLEHDAPDERISTGIASRKEGKGGADENAPQAGQSRVGSAAVCRRANAEINRRVRQSQAALRDSPGGPVQDRGDRPAGETPTGARRSNRGDPDPGAETAGADAQDHRRSLGYRTRPGGLAAPS